MEALGVAAGTPFLDQTPVIVTLALLSALAFSAGIALQSRAALQVPDELAATPSLLARLIRSPLWLMGILGDVSGYGLQATALHHGSLILVQPLLTTSLLFTLMITASWNHESITPSEWGAVLLALTGLAVFLAVAAPTDRSSATATTESWLLCTLSVVVIIGVALATGLRSHGTSRAALLAVAAGFAEAYMASLAKAFSAALDRGIPGVFATWTPYAVVAAGITALLLISTAYQAGHPTVALPIIIVLDPLIACAIGLTLFGEHITITGESSPAIVLSIIGMMTGLLLLSRDDRVAREIIPDAERTQPGVA